MTSSDRAPDDPPETTASMPVSSSPTFPRSHSYTYQVTGVSPTTTSFPSPGKTTRRGSTSLATGSPPQQLVVVTDSSSPLSASTPTPPPPFSASPAQLTPVDTVLPATPGMTMAGGANPSSPPVPRRKRTSTLDKSPRSAVDLLPAGIPFPDNSMTQHFEGPSSAPPTPSVISVTHPSQFIHTHHPRRGSLTPLGLNVISPVPPPQTHTLDNGQTFPIRSVGFSAAGNVDAQSESSRRDSVASTASNLTATRPSTYAMNAIAGSSSAALFSASRRRSSLTPSLSNSVSTSNLNASKRRSSITPFLPTLAAPSPTRAVIAGRLTARPPSSEGTYLPIQSRTMDSITTERRASAAAALFGGDAARRGSLPHLYYGAWTRGPGTPTHREPWNPTLASQRGSVDDTAVIDSSFKFGSPPAASAPESSTGSRTTESGEDTASGSLHRLAQLGSAAKRKDMSAFEVAEQQEADRQRRAFLAATYGEDSRRARARLSLGGPLGPSPGSPASARRQSLLLWERINKPPDVALGIHPSTVSAAAIAAVAAATVLPAPLLHQTLENELARRPSLPINIPMRTPPTHTSESFDDQSIWDNPDSIDPDLTPIRPLPPLLPLSDPVPRLLPSTLALHRATHLLNARGVSSEPLPAPLPPSLHPPAPVDLSEFDIDFILAGSRSNLGRQGSTSSSIKQLGTGDSILRNNGSISGGIGVGGNGGVGEEEDTFAKFVGTFDDEYGGRRGDWTFRACGSSASSPLDPPMDDLGTLHDPTRPRPRAEWDSPGAGRFEIYPNGDVRSVESGAVWRIRKSGLREYEFEQPLRIPPNLLPHQQPHPPKNAPQPLNIAPCAGYTLASKLVHTENGGVKLPFAVQRQLKSKGSRVSRRFAAARHRQSLTAQEVEHHEPRTKRMGSEDSGATAIPINNHQVHCLSTPVLASSVPRPIPTPITTTSPISPIDDFHHHHSSTPKEAKRLSRGRRADREKEYDDDKHKKGFGGVLKRGLFRAQSLVKEYEERNKDRHLFTNGGHSLHGSNHGGHTPVSAGPRQSPARPSPTERPSDPSDAASASSQQSSRANDSPDDLADWPEDAPFGSLGLGIEDEQNGGLPWKEGKAWGVVPDESLAMVIPIESDARTPPLSVSSFAPQPFINPFFVDGPRQALLVWFTPFNASTAELQTPSPLPEKRTGSSSTLFKINESPHHEETSPHGTSLRLPKLLRPRTHRPDGTIASPLASSKTIAVPPPTTTPPSDFDMHSNGGRNSRRESRNFQPLPFKAFRVVAKVVNTEELRSEPEVPVIALEQWTEQLRTGRPAGLHTPPLEAQARMDDVSSSGSGSGSGLTSIFSGDTLSSLGDNSVMSGRAFPTVIAVCHSQKSGVEFVLEGLDRLGLCKGGNAWGPTGYEEWRGTGLSENGRQALDLLWAACTAVMGI